MIKKILSISIFIIFLHSTGFAIDLPNINKSKIRHAIAPGGSESGDIIVENTSTQPRTVKVYLSDWNYLATHEGPKEFVTAGTTPLSACPWITFSPSEITIPAHGKEKINYVIKVPTQAQGGHYAALFFESVFANPQTSKGEYMAGMNIAVRIATLFYIESQGTVNKKASIENFLIRDLPNGKRSLEAEVKNLGNVDITAGGTFHIMDSQSMVLCRQEFKDTYTFPGDTAQLNAPISCVLPAGTYSLVVTLDLDRELEDKGGKEPNIITREGTIKIDEKGIPTLTGPLQ